MCVSRSPRPMADAVLICFTRYRLRDLHRLDPALVLARIDLAGGLVQTSVCARPDPPAMVRQNSCLMSVPSASVESQLPASWSPHYSCTDGTHRYPPSPF